MIDSCTIDSLPLNRTVNFDIYKFPADAVPGDCSLILFNDGQDLLTMNFHQIVEGLMIEQTLLPIICVGIHCGNDRMHEYGLTSAPDYLGRGSKAGQYESFVFGELLPFIYDRLGTRGFANATFAGFSLGALSAMDLAWNHPGIFNRAAAFSGSFWWRSLSMNAPDYNEKIHRLMHSQVRHSEPRAGMKFFFQCGGLDETQDRNRNGVIDSIDDTIDLMKELLMKGYREGTDFCYLQINDGRHDVATWARAIPAFLNWGWAER